MNYISDSLKQLNNLVEDLEDTVKEKYYNYVTEKELNQCYDKKYKEDINEKLTADLFNFFQEFIDLDNDLNEQFISIKTLTKHFNKHCIANSIRKSDRYNILYDFNYLNEYLNYEKLISSKIFNSDTIIISTLYDNDLVIKSMKKLFEGNKTIRFPICCGFTNNYGPISLIINSFASDVTTNYTKGNTINICIQSKQDKTISLYAVDAYYFENKFNNIVANDTSSRLNFKFNNL